MVYRQNWQLANTKMTPMLAEIVMNISSSETLTALKIKGFIHMVP